MTRMPWVSHFGFTRMPFSKTIPANKLCERASHEEAVARIRFCVGESLLGVITGEVGVGKTVAIRAATSQLDPTAHHVIYISTPTFGPRGLYVTIVGALGAHPRLPRAELIAQAHSLLAAEEQERRRRVVLVVDEAHLLTPEQLEQLRLLTSAEMDSTTPWRGAAGRPADAGAPAAHGHFCCARSTHCRALSAGADGPRRIGQLPAPSPGAGRTHRPTDRRRRLRPVAQSQRWPAARAQQRRHRRADRRRRRRQSAGR